MLIIKHDHTLPKNIDICLRKSEQGMMIRSRNDIFETFAILGKSKKVLLGIESEGQVTVVNFDKAVAATVEIRYKDLKVDVRRTVKNEEAIKMVNEAIEMVKKVI